MLRLTARSVAFVAIAASLSACSDDLAAVLAESPSALDTEPVAPVDFDAVYVVNGESATISVVDVRTDTVARTISMRGAAFPRNVALSPDGSTLGIAVPGYDMSNGEFGHAHHSSRPGHVVLLDAVTGALKVAKRMDAANNNVVFSADGRDVWTSQATLPGSTLVLDALELNTRHAISVGTAPAQTVMSKDGALAFVANSGSATVSVIDVAARSVRATIAVGAGPVVAWPAADGFIYVENEPDQSISVIDSRTLTLVRTFSIGYQPGSVSSFGGELWITAPQRGLVEIRSTDGVLTRTVESGIGANAVVFAGDGSRAYVSNELEDTVTVVDRRTMTVSTKIPVGSKPNGMVWRPK